MKARSRHVIAPVILIAAFAAIDACSGLERGDSSPLAEAGCHTGEALKGADCETEPAGPDSTMPETSVSHDDATSTVSSAKDARGDVAEAPGDLADTRVSDVADTGGDVTDASSGSPGCFRESHGLPGCSSLSGPFMSTSICCSGSCVDPTSDTANCGSCGHACPAGIPCYRGACGCPLTICDAGAFPVVCVDLVTDPNHCGACGNVCAGAHRDSGAAACVASACTCPPGQIVCADACVDLTNDPANCGSCGHGCSAGCADSVCLPIPQVLASGQRGPYDLAVDATSVYWTSPLGGTVMKVPLGGGVASVLASSPFSVFLIAVSPTGVYFTERDPVFGDLVMAMPVAGGTPVPIASGLPGLGGIAVDAANAYVTGGSAVVQIPLAGGDSTIFAQPVRGGPFTVAHGLAVDATHVYWTDESASAVLSAALGAGLPVGSLLDASLLDGRFDGGSLVGPPVTLASSQSNPLAIAVDPTSVYWVNHGFSDLGGSVMKVPLGGGPAVTLASGQALPNAIAIDSTSVYWTGFSPSLGGTVSKVPLAGGTVTRLARGQGGPTAIAVDATSVYWVNSVDGTVMKVGK